MHNIKEICFLQIQEIIKNLKFIIGLLLIISLFIINALFFSNNIEKRFDAYSQEYRAHRESLDIEESKPLNSLVFNDFLVIRKPQYSEFIINGNQKVFPSKFIVNIFGVELPKNQNLEIIDSQSNIPVDWVFILSILIPFFILTLTYNAISQEKETGTIKLLFSFPVSKYDYLIGKILGICLVVFIPIVVCVTVNLSLIVLMAKIILSTEIFLKILLVLFYVLIYIFFFTTLGLLISFLTNDSRKSLIISSMVWIMCVLIIPVVLNILVSCEYKVPDKNDLEVSLKQIEKRRTEILSQFTGTKVSSLSYLQKKEAEAKANELISELKQKEKYNYLNKKLLQAKLYNQLCCVSPVYIFDQMLEKLFYTGLTREKNMYQEVLEYQRQLFSFFRDKDLNDNASQHIHFLFDYLSTKEIRYDSIPVFIENNQSVSQSIINSIESLLLLFGIFLILAVWLFIIFLNS